MSFFYQILNEIFNFFNLNKFIKLSLGQKLKKRTKTNEYYYETDYTSKMLTQLELIVNERKQRNVIKIRLFFD